MVTALCVDGIDQKSDNEPVPRAVVGVGGVIWRARKARGWNQLELARRAKVSRDTIVRVEANDDTRLGTLRKIAAALDLDVQEVHAAQAAQAVPSVADTEADIVTTALRLAWHELTDDARQAVRFLAAPHTARAVQVLEQRRARPLALPARAVGTGRASRTRRGTR
jgi:transcriptional regulator with XRE-family HTH domain